MRINRILNRVNENFRPQLETALIERLSDGRIKKNEEIDDFGRGIQKGGKKIAIKIIKNKNYTSIQALKQSKADDQKVIDSLSSGMNWFRAKAKLAITYKAGKLLDTTLLSTMKAVRIQLDTLIKQAE